jgi:hypothetical protein
MRRLLPVLLLTLAALAPALAADAPLRAADVRAFMVHVENASRARDLAQITAVLSPDCRIELRNTVAGREQETLLTREEYVEFLTHGFAALKDLQDYDYVVTSLEVTMEQEPVGATVVSQVRESFTFNGHRMVTESREVSRVERRNGELKLVAVSAETKGD